MAADGRHALSWITAVLAVLAVLGTGCQARTGSTDLATESDRVRVGGIVGIESLFLQFAVDRGFFEEEGLDVDIALNGSGAGTVVGVHDGPLDFPGVNDDRFDIAVSHVALVLLAREDPEALVRHVEELRLIGNAGEGGLPFRMIGTAASAAQDPRADYSQIMVDADSPVTGPADLNGRAIAVDNSSYITEVAIRRSLENVGVEHADIDFVEMQVIDMMTALRDGRVDAIHAVEPVVSMGRKEGLRPIIAPYAGTRPGLAVGSYFASDEFIEQNPEIVRRFVAAVDAAGEYVAAHPDEFRDAIGRVTDLDPEIVADINLPSWGGPVDVPSVELIGELLVGYGRLDQVPPIDEAVHQVAPDSEGS